MADDDETTAYAEVADLEARWRTLSSDEKSRAKVLLGDARVRLDVECPPSTPPTDAELAVREIVSCEMVKRAMINSDSAAGVGSTQTTAGPFLQSFNYTNPTGDLYVTKAERRMLGCGKARAFTIDTAPPGSGVQPWMGSIL